MARLLHPDTAGAGAADDMAAVNEAWRVLSDPGRRAVYDATLRPASARLRPPSNDEFYPVAPGVYDDRRGRLPWGWLAMIGVMLSIFVFTASALNNDTTPPPPDGVFQPGSCADLDDNGDAIEVPCDGPHEALVQQLIPTDASCPIDATEHRDRQGLGKVCLVDG